MVEVKMNWEKMRAKPAAILGRGISGRGLENLLKRLNWNSWTFDEKGIPFSQSKLNDSSVVLSSPGFSPNHPWIRMTQESNVPLYGEMDFASSFIGNDSLAVTGTNGKTTLSYLLAHVMKHLGEKSVLVGNMGYPLSQYLADTISTNERLVLEVSSFQTGNLQILEPAYSFWTNFEDDHLDYHESRRKYFLSKMRLLERTRETSWVGESVRYGARKLKIQLSPSVRVVHRRPSRNFPLSEGHFLSSFPQRENYSIAEAYFRTRGVSPEEFAELVEDFVPQPFRLRQIAQIQETSFWNDSKATNLSATLAACRSMKGRTIWIGGGKSKGTQVDQFAIGMKDYLDQAFVIGEVSDELYSSFTHNGIPVSRCRSLPEAVEGAYLASKSKTNVLFSPGFASFDQFQNYEDRGNLFNQVVFDLKKKTRMSTQVESN